MPGLLIGIEHYLKLQTQKDKRKRIKSMHHNIIYSVETPNGPDFIVLVIVTHHTDDLYFKRRLNPAELRGNLITVEQVRVYYVRLPDYKFTGDP